MNTCTQIGHLSQDVELGQTKNGTAVLNCTIATNRSIPKGDSYVDEATFVSFTMWGKRAEAFARHHQKGSRACITGRLTMETWEDRSTGAPRSKLKMTAEEWEFVSDRGESSSPKATSSPQGIPAYDDTDTPF